MRATPALAIAALLLAGCAGEPARVAPADDLEPVEDDFAQVSESAGAIVGTVVDTSLYPVPNATVSLTGSSRDANVVASGATRTDGAFLFSLVEPGSYRVNVAAPGFANRSILASVAVGQVTKVTVTLDDVPGIEPYIDVIIKNGVTRCTYSTPPWPGDDLGLCGDNSGYSLDFQIPDGFRAFVSETTWRSSEYFSQSFETLNQSSSAATGAWMDMAGPAKAGLRKMLHAGEKRSQVNPNAVFAGIWVPVPTSSFKLSVRTYYSGILADEFNSTIYPACTVFFMQRCAGVGVAVELRFTQYVSVFVHGMPQRPDEYTALPDA